MEETKSESTTPAVIQVKPPDMRYHIIATDQNGTSYESYAPADEELFVEALKKIAQSPALTQLVAFFGVMLLDNPCMTVTVRLPNGLEEVVPVAVEHTIDFGPNTV